MGKSEESRPILAVRFSALGDVAMVLPSLYDACLSLPDRQFIFLTRAHAASIFSNHPSNLKIITPDLKSYSGLPGLFRLFRDMYREYRFSTFIDLHDVLRTKILRLFATLYGVKVSVIRKGRREKRALTRANRKVLVQLTPTVARYSETFRRAGIPQPGTFTALFGKEGADLRIIEKATTPKKKGETWIAIAPFARHRGKIYPPELMEKVVEHFSRRPDTRLFILGFGRDEERVASTWSKKYRNVTDMASKRAGISTEIALLNHCDVTISMDSANMHLASLAGCRVISVWGATHPFTGFLGWHQSAADAVQLDMTCRPCSVFGNRKCRRGDYHCLRGLSPKMIIERVESALQDSSAQKPNDE